MILEIAILDVKAGREKEFEAAFGEAQKIISSMDGYISHQLQKCIEKGSRYILLVNWQTLCGFTRATITNFRLYYRTISDCPRRGRAGRACGAWAAWLRVPRGEVATCAICYRRNCSG